MSESDRLVVEISEHAQVADYDELNSVAAAAPRAGGSGSPSTTRGPGSRACSHILRLSPDLIKLDMGLIARRRQRPSRAGRSPPRWTSFANKSGAGMIAEGIERDEEMRTLIDLDVALGQGFFLARPGPLPLREHV